MLENIESQKILQLVFANLTNERKIIIVKYNKNFKDKLNINLIDYIFLSGRYFVGNRNGKGKENYYNGKLKFEGIYSFGLKYEGKGYDQDGNIIY